ncbi:hypothetical protein GTQ34_03515 [Muricauda sp. JGD-17]|uniref:Uncharacterized protein n=1 Tax=Flagellimonas ochracea TaxID=2696472 RepID=A0A964TBH8_9FLAO|nr:hypothetical protein [Allomuricauda ochracea]NAY90978.1 hypothetical protein [Allomuricauda ochracea]
MKDNNLPEYHQSIFHQLFEHAADIDCKLLLLNEILEIGDIKELPLLELLAVSEHPEIRKKALKVKQAFCEKFGIIPKNETKRLPMSLCFLYDEFNIKPSKVDKDLNMHFEVTLEIFNTDA